MPDSNTDMMLSRREMLKTGLGGLCALKLAGLGGSAGRAYGQTGQKGFMRPRPAEWFSPADGRNIQCGLCPWACRLEPGQRARCRVRTNRDGRGYTLAHGNPVLVQEDPIERKPFFHFLPGSRALSVSTVGCNLECKFCEAWDMALVHPEDVHAYDMPPQNIVEHARAAQLQSISYAFGEPVVSYEYMFETAVLAKEQGLFNLVHTAGFIQPEPLKKLSRVIDAVNIDLKGFDPEFYRDICGGQKEPVLKCLQLLKEAGVHIEITNILIPSLNDDPQKIHRMCTWIRTELGKDVPVHFARFYPLYKLANLPPTPVSTLDRARQTAKVAGLEFVYVARVTGHEGENTFCPGCGQVLIQRVGFVVIQVHLEEGQCRHCRRPIAGRWK